MSTTPSEVDWRAEQLTLRHSLRNYLQYILFEAQKMKQEASGLLPLVQQQQQHPKKQEQDVTVLGQPPACVAVSFNDEALFRVKKFTTFAFSQFLLIIFSLVVAFTFYWKSIMFSALPFCAVLLAVVSLVGLYRRSWLLMLVYCALCSTCLAVVIVHWLPVTPSMNARDSLLTYVSLVALVVLAWESFSYAVSFMTRASLVDSWEKMKRAWEACLTCLKSTSVQSEGFTRDMSLQPHLLTKR